MTSSPKGLASPRRRGRICKTPSATSSPGGRSANAVTEVHGCAITYDGPKPQDISYARDVAPILQNKCVGCHSAGNIGPFAMSSYAKVKGWSAMIDEVVLDRRMPPWHADPHFGKFANDRSLTAAESQTLTQWIMAGCPRGEGEDPLEGGPAGGRSATPASIASLASNTWVLGKPDFLVRIPRQDIPATGTVDYRYIDSDFVAPQDMWLRAAVTRPGNPKVVHHIIVRMRQPDDLQGAAVRVVPVHDVGAGARAGGVPAGYRAVRAEGRGVQFRGSLHDQRRAADGREPGRALPGEGAAEDAVGGAAPPTRGNWISPRARPNAQHTAKYSFKHDSMVFGLSPHMHLRGLVDEVRADRAERPSRDAAVGAELRFQLADELPARYAAARAGGFVDALHRRVRQLREEPPQPRPEPARQLGPADRHRNVHGLHRPGRDPRRRHRRRKSAAADPGAVKAVQQ